MTLQRVRLRLAPSSGSGGGRWISAWVDLAEFPHGPNRTALARANAFFARFVPDGERIAVVDLSQGNGAGGG